MLEKVFGETVSISKRGQAAIAALLGRRVPNEHKAFKVVLAEASGDGHEIISSILGEEVNGVGRDRKSKRPSKRGTTNKRSMRAVGYFNA